MNLRALFSSLADEARAIDPIDVLALSSVAVVAAGVAMIYVPAAFLVVGVLGLAYAIFASRSETTP